MKAFENWESEEIELTFGLKRHRMTPDLKEWLNTRCEIPESIKNIVSRLQNNLIDHAEFWNEDEIKFLFISPLVTLVDFSSETYNCFTQRPMATTRKDVNNNDVLLKGRVELVVAKGKQHPRVPFFFLHEYKTEKRRDNDPLGQLMAAMLVAQHQNADNQPLLGCYVVGRFWFFVYLKDNDYAVSNAFDATQEDIYQIYAILSEAKRRIQERVKVLAAG